MCVVSNRRQWRLSWRRLSRDFDDDASCSPPVVSSRRLLDLGFRFRYGVEDVVKDSVAQCLAHGFLEQPEGQSTFRLSAV